MSRQEKIVSRFLKSSIFELQKHNIPQKKADNNRSSEEIIKTLVFILKIEEKNIFAIFDQRIKKISISNFYHFLETIVSNNFPNT